MRLPLPTRLVLRPWLLALGTVLTLTCATSLRAEPSGEVKDPHYGDTLYQYFQEQYFSALTQLMASQHFGRVSHHAEEAEVLRGGILLSYGLHRQAGDLFTRLIDMGATPATRDRAWYFLAKIRYQRDYLAEAQDALARIGTALPPALQEDRVLLQAHVQMARGEYAAAATTLATVDSKAPSARYARYNLGIALIKAGETDRGTAVLDELGRATAEDEEYRGLRDRANVALGFAALADNRQQQASTYLERVRLKSPQANKALLGLGWAASARKETAQALAPWLELSQRDVSDSAVLEAQIAVPYAYAELGAYGQAAQGYEQAIATFTRESTALNESIAAIQTGTLVNALVERNPGDEMGWFWGVRELPDMPHASHLATVLAQHEFQEALKNYRDLLFLTRNLQEWRDKLSVFDDMLVNRRKAFAERLPLVRQRASEIAIGPLQQRHAAASALVTAGETAADGVAFADAKQLALLDRVARVQTALKGASDSDESTTARNRVRLAAGALTWQLAQDYPGRVWQAKKQLQTIQDELATAQRLDAALAQAQRDEPVRFDAFAQRIAAMSPVIDAMLPRVAALSKEQQQAVQVIAIAALARQQERLGQYSTQARFALAQLYDRNTDHTSDRATERATPAPEAGRATKP
jgi:hypothetical protein